MVPNRVVARRRYWTPRSEGPLNDDQLEPSWTERGCHTFHPNQDTEYKLKNRAQYFDHSHECCSPNLHYLSNPSNYYHQHHHPNDVFVDRHVIETPPEASGFASLYRHFNGVCVCLGPKRSRRTEEVLWPRQSTTQKIDSIGSQRVRSLQALARVQRNAAQLIQVGRSPGLIAEKCLTYLVAQREFRLFRVRRQNRLLRKNRLHAAAEQFVFSILRDELLWIVPDALIDVMREGNRSQLSLLGANDMNVLSEELYHELLRCVVIDLFQAALNSAVREYMISRIDTTQLSESPSHAVANCIVQEWIREMMAEVVPEGKVFAGRHPTFQGILLTDLHFVAITELVPEYVGWIRQETLLLTLLADELRSVLVDAQVELTLDQMLKLVSPS